MHDPRIGRFFAIDPLAYSFPWNSPYAFSENMVIDAIEIEGLEGGLVNGNTRYGTNASRNKQVYKQSQTSVRYTRSTTSNSYRQNGGRKSSSDYKENFREIAPTKNMPRLTNKGPSRPKRTPGIEVPSSPPSLSFEQVSFRMNARSRLGNGVKILTEAVESASYSDKFGGGVSLLKESVKDEQNKTTMVRVIVEFDNPEDMLLYEADKVEYNNKKNSFNERVLTEYPMPNKVNKDGSQNMNYGSEMMLRKFSVGAMYDLMVGDSPQDMLLQSLENSDDGSVNKTAWEEEKPVIYAP